MHVQSHTHGELSEVGGIVIKCTTQTQGPTTVENFFLTSHILGYNIKVLPYINNSVRSINEYCPGVTIPSINEYCPGVQ